MAKKGNIPWNKGKKGLQVPWNKGTTGLVKANSGSFKKGQKSWNSGTAVEKVKKVRNINSNFKKGHIPYNKGIILSDEVRNNISIAHIGIPNKTKGIKRPKFSGENHPNWIKNRSLVKLDTDRGGPLHKYWSIDVKKRDKFLCRIADSKCNGRLEAHHILGWKEYPELRYQINNGITLCHAHHPRKRAEEKRLIPTFTELVSMSVSK